MKKLPVTLFALSVAVAVSIPLALAVGNVYQEKQQYDFYDDVNVRGVLTVAGNTTLTTPLTAANIQSGSAKRELSRVQLSPVTGAAVDSTLYAGLFAPNRAGTITRIGFVAGVAPTVGTDTIEALKNNTTTCLSAATFDANTLVAYTTTNATLTSTGADKLLTATDVVRFKYNAGAQTVDAVDLEAVVEFEPTDF